MFVDAGYRLLAVPLPREGRFLCDPPNDDAAVRRRRDHMPMIDVYAAADLFPANADRQLAEELTRALLRAEGVEKPDANYLNNTGAFIHRMPPSTVHTAASGSPRTVRVQVLTPPGILNRARQRQLVKEATEIIARVAGDPTQAARTWVL